MNGPISHPTPIELRHAPEAGALALLDHALFSAAFALLATNETVRDECVDGRHLDKQALAAEAVLRDAKALQGALRRYLDLAIARAKEQIRFEDDCVF